MICFEFAAEKEWIVIDTLGLVVLACLLAIFINQSFPVFSLAKGKIDTSLEKKNYEPSPVFLCWIMHGATVIARISQCLQKNARLGK